MLDTYTGSEETKKLKKVRQGLSRRDLTIKGRTPSQTKHTQ